MNEEKKKDDKQKKEEEKEKKRFSTAEEEIRSMIEEMKEAMGSDFPGFKIVSITPKERRKLMLFRLLGVLSKMIVLFALHGYFEWFKYEKIWQIFLLFGSIVAIDNFLSYLLRRYGIKLIIRSFGMIGIAGTIMAWIFAFLVTPGIQIVNFGRLMLCFLLYLVIDKLIVFLIGGKRILK